MIVGQLVRIYTFEMPQNDILEPDHDSYDLLDPFLLDPRKESLDPLIPEDTFLDSLFLSFVDEFLLLLLLGISSDGAIFCGGATEGWVVRGSNFLISRIDRCIVFLLASSKETHSD
jgi:hypothetical protein